MPKLTFSTRIYLGLIVVLAAPVAINVFLPRGGNSYPRRHPRHVLCR